jgi:hypothetical protein
MQAVEPNETRGVDGPIGVVPPPRARPLHYAGPARKDRSARGPDLLSRGLGLFSLGLGAAMLARPGGLARFAGVRDGRAERRLLGGVGLREIASGVGILAQAQPHGWVWARVAGDAMDVSFVGFELLSGRAKNRRRATAALAGLAGIAALDAFVAARYATGEPSAPQVATVTVNGTPEEVGARWRNGELRPTFRAAPGGRGTEVSVKVERRRHADVLEELRRFKQTFEAGEPVRSEATANGNGMPQRSARPLD